MKQQGSGKKKSATVEDFEFKRSVGRGAFGDVYLVQHHDSHKVYVIKQIQKRVLSKQHKQYQAYVERQLLSKIRHPGIVRLFNCFSSEHRLYFVLEYLQGQVKELYREFDGWHDCFIYFIAQLINVLEFLHSNGITHRDLKPQNILITREGQLKLIDFGTAQINRCPLLSKQFKEKIERMKKESEQERKKVQLNQQVFRRSTFELLSNLLTSYISPELLEYNICQHSADLWALGCIVYQLFYGYTPFHDTQEFAIYEKIKNVQYNFQPNTKISASAKDFIAKLLVKEPKERLGAGPPGSPNDMKALKDHQFLRGINVDQIYSKGPPEQYLARMRKQTKKQDVKESKEEVRQEKQQPKMLICATLQLKKMIGYQSCNVVLYDNGQLQYGKKGHRSPVQAVSLKQPNKLLVKTEHKELQFKGEGLDNWLQLITETISK